VHRAAAAAGPSALANDQGMFAHLKAIVCQALEAAALFFGRGAACEATDNSAADAFATAGVALLRRLFECFNELNLGPAEVIRPLCIVLKSLPLSPRLAAAILPLVRAVPDVVWCSFANARVPILCVEAGRRAWENERERVDVSRRSTPRCLGPDAAVSVSSLHDNATAVVAGDLTAIVEAFAGSGSPGRLAREELLVLRAEVNLPPLPPASPSESSTTTSTAAIMFRKLCKSSLRRCVVRG